MPSSHTARHGKTDVERRSEVIAAWITAVATAVQTAAVTAALFVAAREWIGHEHQSQTAKRDAILKLYAEQPKDVSDARNYASKYTRCHILARILNPDPTSPEKKMLDECRTEGVLSKSAAAVSSETEPLERMISRIQLCVRADICDQTLARQLFCDDGNLLRQRDRIFLDRRLQFYSGQYVDFVLGCPEFRLEVVPRDYPGNEPASPSGLWLRPSQ
jgi:hypothetical protein